tara:strand:- start:825 stop:1208 length:384 start_codon:yes stop_codon:yes gene_type:complete
MCFVINKHYAGELGSINDIDAKVGKLKDSPVEIADLVAVQNSGVKNVLNIGHGSALVETAMAPQNLKDNNMNARANLVEVVSRCVDTVLKNHDVKNEDKRMEIAQDVCDEILLFLDNPKNYKKKNER